MRKVVAMFVRCAGCRHMHKRNEVEFHDDHFYCTTDCCSVTDIDMEALNAEADKLFGRVMERQDEWRSAK